MNDGKIPEFLMPKAVETERAADAALDAADAVRDLDEGIKSAVAAARRGPEYYAPRTEPYPRTNHGGLIVRAHGLAKKIDLLTQAVETLTIKVRGTAAPAPFRAPGDTAPQGLPQSIDAAERAIAACSKAIEELQGMF